MLSGYEKLSVAYISVQELEQGVPTQRRVRAMRELREIVASKRLEEVKNSAAVADSSEA